MFYDNIWFVIIYVLYAYLTYFEGELVQVMRFPGPRIN